MWIDDAYTLELRGLTYWGRHGVWPAERQRGQPFRVDVTLVYEAGELEDTLERAVDYGAAERVVAAVVEGAPVQLLETLADRIARTLLDAFPALSRVDVAVHKPQAPLAGIFDDVVARRSVRRVVRAYLGLGANLGDRAANLRSGVRYLQSREELRIAAVSPLYETEPQDVLDQPAFLNAVLAVDTIAAPTQLLAICKQAEAAAGRLPGIRRGPRPLDVDILLYGQRTLVSPQLVIPHPRLEQRAFALRPLLDLAPEATLPDGRSLRSLLTAAADQAVRWVAGPEWAAGGDKP